MSDDNIIINLKTKSKFTPKKTNEQKNKFLILKNIEDYDLNAPYQRSFVWNDKLKQKLINTIIAKQAPIQPITLVEKEDCDGYYVLDGKQRLNAITSFKEDRFKVPIEFGECIKNKSKKSYSYSNICDSIKKIENIKKGKITEEKKSQLKVFKEFLKRFEEYNMYFTIYSNLDFNDQKKLFEDINNSKQLSIADKRYGSYFATSHLLSSLCQKYFNANFLKYFSKKFKENKEREKLDFLHKIFTLVYGGITENNFKNENEFGANLDSQSLKNDAKKTENYLKNKKIDHSKISEITDYSHKDIKKNEIDEEKDFLFAFYKHDIHGKIETLEETVKIFTKLISEHKKRNDNIKITRNFLFDIFFFLFYLCDKNKNKKYIINETYCSHNFVKLINFTNKYYKEKGSNMHSTLKDEIKKRFVHMMTIYESEGLNGIGKDISSTEKNKIKSEYIRKGIVEKCPIIGIEMPLEEDELEVDHVTPKSSNSNSKYSVVSKSGNRIKGAMTKETAQNLIESGYYER